MNLQITSVPKCLDQKLSLLGFEVLDVIAIFLMLSVLNLVFGSTNFKLCLVWLPTLIFTLVLRIGKYGKPENYLIHWLRYQFTNGYLTAFNVDLYRDLSKTLEMKRSKI